MCECIKGNKIKKNIIKFKFNSSSLNDHRHQFKCKH